MRLQRGYMGAIFGTGGNQKSHVGLVIFLCLIGLLMFVFKADMPGVSKDNIITALFGAITGVIGFIMGAKPSGSE